MGIRYPLVRTNRIINGFKFLEVKRKSWSTEEINFFNDLVSFIKTIDSFNTGNVTLEQYTLPDDLIAYILVENRLLLDKKNVVEFGSGTGRFSIPLAKFFVNKLLCVDIDANNLFMLQEALKSSAKDINFLVAALEFLDTHKWKNNFDVTIQNPPFGTKRYGIDMIFLKKALEFSEVVISLHKSNEKSRRLIRNVAEDYGKKAEITAKVQFFLPKIFSFHTKQSHTVLIDIYRFYDK